MNMISNFLFKNVRNGSDAGLLITRLVVCLALLYGHGFGKLSVIFSGREIQFMDPIGIGAELSFYMAAFAEGICAIFLLVGLFSRLTSFVLTLNFVVIFFFHAFIAKDAFNGIELPLLYLSSFCLLAITGAGKFSLDYYYFKSKIK
ncbi:MAG: DoxX family protein [Crocinitomicaceae bacterium]|nr:DoxX family protein [Crocinitomicaceae bacterium]